MKFDDLCNKILNEDESLDIWHKAQMDKEAKGNDFMDMIKSMPTDQLTSLYIEDLSTMYTGGLFDRHEQEKAKQLINLIKQELLSRGESEEKLNTIEDDIKEEIIAAEGGDNY